MSDKSDIARAQAQLDGCILPLGTPLQAIQFAITQSVEAQIFLEAWLHGDIREWPEYQEFLNANPSNQRDGFTVTIKNETDKPVEVSLTQKEY